VPSWSPHKDGFGDRARPSGHPPLIVRARSRGVEYHPPDVRGLLFIDCPPSIGWLTLNAFTASDKIIVVVSPGYFELDSIVQINKTIDKVKEEFNPTLELFGMLFNLSENTNATVASLQLLRQTYPHKVFHTIIPRNTDVKEAQLSKQDLFTFNSKANAAIAYKKLIKEIFGYE
jgi:chromosome partitioning protein